MMHLESLNQLTPFHSEKGKLVFPIEALRNLVYVWPVPPPEKIGSFYIPKGYRRKYHDGVGIILTVGPGFTDRKGRFFPTPSELRPGVKVMFDIQVPWGESFTGQDGKPHYVCLCGIGDVFGIVSGLEGE